jgi:hypothetical protein
VVTKKQLFEYLTRGNNMPALTTDERGAFAAAQLVQIDRLPAARRDELLDFNRSVGLARLQSRSVDQLKARVNILKVNWGPPIVVTYSSENDYTATERQTIADSLKDGKWLFRIPEILAAGLSIEQRLTAGGL